MIAVTGGSGHIGANLVRALLERGERLRVLVRENERSLHGLPIEEIKGDVRDLASLRRCFEGAELVYHLAAKIAIGREKYEEVAAINVEGVRNVATACREVGVKRLLHFSSIHAISPLPRDLPVDEDRPLLEDLKAPVYDRSKAAGERVLREAIDQGLDAVVVNPTGVIGPNDFTPSRMGTVLLYLRARKLPGLVDGGFNWVDARDVVQGAIAAAARGKAGDRFVLSGEWLSVTEVAEAVEQLTGARKPWFTSSMWLARVGAPFAGAWAAAFNKPVLFTSAALHALRDHRHVTHEKATRVLDFHPRAFKETLKDTFSWFDAHQKGA